jgi:hypothetical protein
MGSRGKRSNAEVVTLNIQGTPARLVAPSGLTAAERKLFTEIVADCHPKHFVKSDLPLLVSFIQSTLISRSAATKLARDPEYLMLWQTATRMQATLATRLRLAPQARTDPKTQGFRSHSANEDGSRPPWNRND